MKIQPSLHYLRIHAKVWRRLWSEIPNRMRDIIAADTEHRTEQYKWFESKVEDDARRLYEDPNYFDNAEYTFRIAKHERQIVV
jgi:hypothetical protein